jgi:hypothetical protein
MSVAHRNRRRGSNCTRVRAFWSNLRRAIATRLRVFGCWNITRNALCLSVVVFGAWCLYDVRGDRSVIAMYNPQNADVSVLLFANDILVCACARVCASQIASIVLQRRTADRRQVLMMSVSK